MVADIVRVEHSETGVGPYRDNYHGTKAAIYLNDMVNRHCKPSKHPSPHDDTGINRSPKSGEFCGFKDLKQLHQWFTDDEIIIMESFGYKITTIENVEIIVEGEKQILYCK